MKSKQRQRIADLATARFQRMQRQNGIEKTGKEELRAILGLDTEKEINEISPTEPETEKRIVLYLKEGLTGAERNWTKYPNEIHKIMADRLTEYESVLYIKLWRESWGYGRNYCRHSYSDTMEETTIRSLSTARRATAGLKEKRFIIMVLNEDDIADITKEGTLYRIITPQEIIKGEVEEGVPLYEIPVEGVFCVNMVTENIVERTSKNGAIGTMFPENMVRENIVLTEHGQREHNTMSTQNMVRENIDLENSNKTTIPREGVLSEHGRAEHPLKEKKKDIKDTLSPRAIVSGFYRGIGQPKITTEKRERAEKSFKELTKDGFSLDDIHFAVEWTLKNSKEEPYDFSIIKHTIGQAMAAKKKTEAEKAKRIEAERIAAQERAEEELREKEAAKIEAYKESLSAEERAKLRERAEAEIRNSGQFKEEFITDYLIEVKENELIRKQIGKKMSE